MTLDDAYQPDSDIDARSAAHQILGDAFGDVYGGDWEQALRDAPVRWALERTLTIHGAPVTLTGRITKADLHHTSAGTEWAQLIIDSLAGPIDVYAMPVFHDDLAVGTPVTVTGEVDTNGRHAIVLANVVTTDTPAPAAA